MGNPQGSLPQLKPHTTSLHTAPCTHLEDTLRDMGLDDQNSPGTVSFQSSFSTTPTLHRPMPWNRMGVVP